MKRLAFMVALAAMLAAMAWSVACESRTPVTTPDTSPTATQRPLSSRPAKPRAKLVLVAHQANSSELYVVDHDGSNRSTLALLDGLQPYTLSYTSASHSIVFAAEYRGQMPAPRTGNEVYTVDIASGKVSQLTHTPGNETNPQWSPDGTKIAFQYAQLVDNTARAELYVMDADGKNRRKLGSMEYGAIFAWSPDGKTIAATAAQWPAENIYLVNVETGEETNITRLGAGDLPPGADSVLAYWVSWSPDGGKLAFAADRHGPLDIYVATFDGDQQTRMTAWPFEQSRGAGYFQPRWSLDGKRIAYIGRRVEANSNVWIMNSDGTGQSTLAELPGKFNLGFGLGSMLWASGGMELAASIVPEPGGSRSHVGTYVIDVASGQMIKASEDFVFCWLTG